jgi:hypothetical protein
MTLLSGVVLRPPVRGRSTLEIDVGAGGWLAMDANPAQCEARFPTSRRPTRCRSRARHRLRAAGMDRLGERLWGASAKTGTKFRLTRSRTWTPELRFGLTERRRSRTYPAVGYTTWPVLEVHQLTHESRRERSFGSASLRSSTVRCAEVGTKLRAKFALRRRRSVRASGARRHDGCRSARSSAPRTGLAPKADILWPNAG